MKAIKYVNNKEIWIFLFSCLVAISVIYACSVFFNGDSKSKVHKNNYVEINGKEYDLEEFNEVIYGERLFDKSIVPDVNKVKRLIYIGNKDLLNSKIFDLFPNIEYISINNCIISDVNLEDKLKHLNELELNGCEILNGTKISSVNIEILTLECSEIGEIIVDLPNLKSLVLNYVDITENLIYDFGNCKKIDRLSIVGSTLENIEMLVAFKNISCLRMFKAKTSGYEKLKIFTNLNEIYLDENIDRNNIDFMYTNFKNGDMFTRAYFIKKRHNLND